MNSPDVEIQKLSKEFYTVRRKVRALWDINLKVEEGEFFVILGPSGCGKSTMLNIIAGLEKPISGEIWFGKTPIVSIEKDIFLTPKERNVSMVFQSYALYPHMNVYENIAFPLRIAKFKKEEIKKRVDEIVKMLDIENLLSSKPKELSGGQRQRVAIARALVRHPSIFLLDEPLSNLDAQLRVKMREELKNLQRQLGITTIYVTHDQVEAMTLGDRIGILRKGQLQQIGKPMEVYKSPVNTFVAGFIGTPPMNLIKGKIYEKQGNIFVRVDNISIKIDTVKIPLINKLNTNDVIVGIRPEDIIVAEKNNNSIFESEIKFVEHLGAETILYFNVGGNKMIVKLLEDKGYKEGDKAKLLIKTEKMHIFDKNGINIKEVG